MMGQIPTAEHQMNPHPARKHAAGQAGHVQNMQDTSHVVMTLSQRLWMLGMGSLSQLSRLVAEEGGHVPCLGAWVPGGPRY